MIRRMLQWTGALAALTLLVPNPAYAGAWTLNEGQGQLILSATHSSGEPFAGSDGWVGEIPETDKNEVYLLVEYGLTDQVTLLATPSLSDVRVRGGASAHYSGFGYTELGGRVRLASNPANALSLQASVRLPGASDPNSLAEVGQTVMELDTRILWGRNLPAGRISAFANSEIGVRWRGGSPPDELRGDFTLGTHLSPRWMLLAQSFNVVSLGNGGPRFPKTNYHKAALSLVHKLDERWSLQLSSTTTIAGHNALREEGLTLGLWHRF